MNSYELTYTDVPNGRRYVFGFPGNSDEVALGIVTKKETEVIPIKLVKVLKRYPSGNKASSADNQQATAKT